MSRSRHVRPSSAAVPRHRRARDLPRLIRRGTIGAGIVAVAALIGLGGTAALWSSTTSIAPGAVTSGSLTASTSTGTAVQSAAYTAGADSSRNLLLDIANTGSTAATLSAKAGAISGELAGSVTVAFAKVSAGADCATVTTYGPAGSWTALPALSGTVEAGTRQYVCVKTTLPKAQATAGSYTVSLSLTLSKGGWSASTTTTISQSVATSTSGATITCAIADGGGITIGWAQSAGMKNGDKYRITVGGVEQPNSANAGYHTNVDFRPAGMSSLAPGSLYTMNVYGKSQSVPVATRQVYWTSSSTVLCEAPPEKPVSTLPKLTCTNSGTYNVTLSWENPSTADANWTYEVRSGDTVIYAQNLSYYWRTPTIGTTQMGSLARGTVYEITVLRADGQHATELYSGALQYYPGGQVQCA